MKKSKNQSTKPHIDYDGWWKRMINMFFKPFITFFMPELLEDIDFSKPPIFLEQELATIIPRQTAEGRMSVDKLLKIPMKNGGYEHIFLHVEVQSQRKVNFTEKTFKYFYRIFDSKGKAITTFVVYAHDDVPTSHDRYEYSFRGTELTYKFNSYLVRDADENELLKSDNVFALVVLTCKYINQTKNDFELRQKFKVKLFRLALERNYSKEHITELINFINILMYLPPEIKQGFDREVEQEFKQTSMVEDQYIVLDKAEVLEFKTAKEQVEVLESKVEEQRKATEEQRKANMNIIRNLISSTSMTPTEVAKIADISVEEVLRIKAEMEG